MTHKLQRVLVVVVSQTCRLDVAIYYCIPQTKHLRLAQHAMDQGKLSGFCSPDETIRTNTRKSRRRGWGPCGCSLPSNWTGGRTLSSLEVSAEKKISFMCGVFDTRFREQRRLYHDSGVALNLGPTKQTRNCHRRLSGGHECFPTGVFFIVFEAQHKKKVIITHPRPTGLELSASEISFRATPINSPANFLIFALLKLPFILATQ